MWLNSKNMCKDLEFIYVDSSILRLFGRESPLNIIEYINPYPANVENRVSS
jgi:hypothetical protein